jgi:hypothetical protein
MTRLIGAELLKLRSTQVWLWLLAAVVLLGGGIVAGSFATSGAVKDAHDVANSIAYANGACVATFILGALGITTEYRHQTITPTLLGTPSRWAVVGAKLIGYAIVGAGYAVACLAVQLSIALPWASAKGIDLGGDGAELRRVVLGMVAVLTLMALVGVGVGALVKNQVVTIVVSLVFFFVLEGVISAIPYVRDVWRYTPSGGITSLLFTGSDARVNDAPVLSHWGGALVLLAWAAVPAVIGAGLTMRRDIT